MVTVFEMETDGVFVTVQAPEGELVHVADVIAALHRSVQAVVVAHLPVGPV